MFTSYFANVKKIVAANPSLVPVAVSIGIPAWFKGRRELSLAPTRKMLKMPADEYDALYAEILRKLDPKEIFDRLGDNAVMLCWEKPGEPCHRRNVAEWLEHHLKIVVPEFGIERAETGQQSTSAYDFVR